MHPIVSGTSLWEGIAVAAVRKHLNLQFSLLNSFEVLNNLHVMLLA